MKQFQSIIYLSVVLFVLTACRGQEEFDSVVLDGGKPTAGFTYVADGMILTFTDNSREAESYYWSFGDGTTSTEKSPTHTYGLAGSYIIRLKVNNVMGYSDTYESEPVIVADKVTAAFSSMPELGLGVAFDSRASQSIVSAAWDFGDGTIGEGLTISHEFPAEGDYDVTLTATGMLGDTKSITQKVTVFKNMNLLKASDMDADAGDYWQVMISAINFKFGYTDDKPITGEGGCLRFAPFEGRDGTILYQGVQVQAGRKYKLSAQVKAPAGAKNAYVQFYIAPKAETEDDFIENNTSSTNHYLALNTWNGWGDNNDGSRAVDGDLYDACQANGKFGLGATNGGIYEAPETRTVYIGIKVYTQISIGEVLIDNVLFELQE